MKSSSSPQHIEFLDEIRGGAILLVFLYHCLAPNFSTEGSYQLAWNGWLRDFNVPWSFLAVLPFTIGWAGVAIFFVVSGFCIHLSHERSREKGWDVFLIRRFFRIYPPYLIALLFFALVFPWSRLDFSSSLRHAHTELFASMVCLVSHLGVIHNYSTYVAYQINGAFWSIAVEVQLYVLYPLLLLLVRYLGWSGALWITGIIEIGLRSCEAIADTNAGWLVMSPFYFWFSWTLGAALAEAYLKKKPLPLSGISLGFFPLLTLVFFFFKPLSYFCFTLAALSTVCLMVRLLTNAAKSSETMDKKPNSWFRRHLESVGLVSYSVYLIHQPLILGVDQVMLSLFPGDRIPYLAMFAICAGSWFLILIPSYAMYLWIEKPSIAWGKWLIGQRKGAEGLHKKAVA